MFERIPVRLNAFLIAVVFALSPKLVLAQDVFHSLGDLAGGSFNSRALGVSPDGNTIVGWGTNNDGQRGFRWTQSGGMIQLNGAFSGETIANGVSNTGIAVGRSPGLFGGDLATYWNPDGSVGGSLGDFSGGSTYSEALGVSADGSVIVGIGTDASSFRSFRWTTSTGLQDLGINGAGSRANAISGNGQVIVGSTFSNGQERAYRWENGTHWTLGFLPGGDFAQARAVSGDGSVVAGRSTAVPVALDAFRWTENAGMSSLGIPNSSAFGISDDGSIIVGASGQDGFVWDLHQGARDLRNVLSDDFGMDVSQWANLVPVAISADGLTIVGFGEGPNTSNGQNESFRVSVDARWIRSASGSWNSRSNWAFGINPNELHDLMITPTTGLSVTKSSGTSTIRSLDLRATSGTASLNLQGSTVNVLNTTSIGNGGRLTGNDTATFNAVGGISNLGTIDLGTGLQITGGTINNLGLVRGSGEIASRLVNPRSGEIRVGPGQHMRLTGITSPNQGLINVTGGTFEVSRAYVNDGDAALIYARDAVLRFNGGLTNGGTEEGGSIGISYGTTDIYGDVNNRIRGVINVSGGANVTFVDDLTQNGRLEVVRVGNTVSRAVIFGEFSGAGGFVGGGDVFALGDLRPGNSPASVLMDGNLYFGSGTDSYFELGGLDLGQFDQIVVTGELGLAGDLFVSLVNGFQLNYDDRFLIADVGQSLSGQFMNLGEGALVGNFGGINLFITYAGGNGNDVLLFSAVPEPGCLSLLAVCAVNLAFLRRKRKQI